MNELKEFIIIISDWFAYLYSIPIINWVCTWACTIISVYVMMDILIYITEPDKRHKKN